MKKMKKGIALLCLMALTIGFMVSCSKMDVGYLRTTGASFTPDSLNAFHNVDATSERGINKLPFVSTRIQGVAGTNLSIMSCLGLRLTIRNKHSCL